MRRRTLRGGGRREEEDFTRRRTSRGGGRREEDIARRTLRGGGRCSREEDVARRRFREEEMSFIGTRRRRLFSCGCGVIGDGANVASPDHVGIEADASKRKIPEILPLHRVVAVVRVPKKN